MNDKLNMTNDTDGGEDRAAYIGGLVVDIIDDGSLSADEKITKLASVLGLHDEHPDDDEPSGKSKDSAKDMDSQEHFYRRRGGMSLDDFCERVGA